MDYRNVYAIPELDPTDNDVDNVADQRLESSMENDAETLRDTNKRTDASFFPSFCHLSPSPPLSPPSPQPPTPPKLRPGHHLRSFPSFPAVTVEPAAGISSFFSDSSPAAFSLLLPPFPTHEMSDLIRRGRSVMTAPSSDPPAQPASAATAPAMMDHVPVGPGGSQAPASLASSVAQPVSARRRHRPASTTDTTSTDATGALGSQLESREFFERKIFPKSADLISEVVINSDDQILSLWRN
ncbi:hypothetical protein L3X38_033975 [Prunus dulcis]|uniref:Uncharacterized protein n=1 Tax=Prunus dulcis TaxID=3755 RepID=A0AAD4VJE2_PRUDU|nr:hypothetical protein L3X38_033975 [Prunus dulcis]